MLYKYSSGNLTQTMHCVVQSSSSGLRSVAITQIIVSRTTSEVCLWIMKLL